METNLCESEELSGCEGGIDERRFAKFLKKATVWFLPLYVVVIALAVFLLSEMLLLISEENKLIAALTILGIVIVMRIYIEKREEVIRKELQDEELKNSSQFNRGMDIVGAVALIFIVVAPWMWQDIIRTYPIASLLVFLITVSVGCVINKKMDKGYK